MPDKQETITMHVNGVKTTLGVQPLKRVVVPDKRDEKPVSGEQKGSDDGTDA